MKVLLLKVSDDNYGALLDITTLDELKSLDTHGCGFIVKFDDDDIDLYAGWNYHPSYGDMPQDTTLHELLRYEIHKHNIKIDAVVLIYDGYYE